MSAQIGLMLAIAGAGFIAYFIYRLTSSVSIEKSSDRRISAFALVRQTTIFDRIGQFLIRRMGLSLLSWRENLRWAQLGDHYTSMTLGGILGRSLLYCLLALGYVTVTASPPVTWLGAVVVFLYLPVRISARAKVIRKEVSRTLPEVAALIAAEMAAGNSPDQALSRAAEIPGPLGKLLMEAIKESRRSQLPLFSRPQVEGVMVSTLSEMRMPSLQAFANQLDLVARKGAEAPKLMAEIAGGFALQYHMEVSRAAEQLENNLLFPMLVYFFAPFMVALLMPLFISLFRAF